MVKNTLVKQALKDKPWAQGLTDALKGMTGVAWSYEDPSAAAKVVKEFRKDNEKLKVKAGLIEGQLLDSEAVENQLATMPGKNELRAQLLATLQAPLQSFVALLQAPAQNFVYVLVARKSARRTDSTTHNDFDDSGRRKIERRQVPWLISRSEQVVDYLSNLPVIQIAEPHQDPRGQVGRQGCSGCRRCGGGCCRGCGRSGRREDRVHGRARRRWRQQDQRHQGRPRDHRSWPQRSEGPGRRRPKTLKEGVAKAEAEDMKKKLEEAGAKVELK